MAQRRAFGGSRTDGPRADGMLSAGRLERALQAFECNELLSPQRERERERERESCRIKALQAFEC